MASRRNSVIKFFILNAYEIYELWPCLCLCQVDIVPQHGIQIFRSPPRHVRLDRDVRGGPKLHGGCAAMWLSPRYNPDYEKFPQFAKAQCGQAPPWSSYDIGKTTSFLMYFVDFFPCRWRCLQGCHRHLCFSVSEYDSVIFDEIVRSCYTTQLTGGIIHCRHSKSFARDSEWPAGW